MFVFIYAILFFKPIYSQQNLLNDRYKTEYNFFNLSDSVKTASIVYYNSTFYKATKTGLIAGVIGAGVTLGGFLIAYSADKNCDLGCAIAVTMLPIIVGGVSLIAGTAISYYASDKPKDEFINYPYPKRTFNQIGITASIFGSVNTPDYDMVKIGITYRNKNQKYFLPNRISLLYGGGYGYACDYSIYTSNLSLEAVNINYDKLFSWYTVLSLVLPLQMQLQRPDIGKIKLMEQASTSSQAVQTRKYLFHLSILLLGLILTYLVGLALIFSINLSLTE